MTGSGKTGLCLSLLEEAALDGVPAIAIDPKGDIGNLMLTFPELRPADFQPWVDAGEAARKGQSVEEFAAATAATWQKGLAEWNEDGARIQRLRDAAEVAIYTPGSKSGRPLSVLRSFAAPDADDARRRDRAQGAHRRGRRGPARAARHRRRSDQEPRVPAAVRHPGRRAGARARAPTSRP